MCRYIKTEEFVVVNTDFFLLSSQSFKYDRFLNGDMTPKVDFYKSNRRLKYYTMPFGGGANVCAGKTFAITSIKQ